MADDWTHAVWTRVSRGPWQRIALARSEAEAVLIAQSYVPSVAYCLERCQEAPELVRACPPLAWRVLPRGQAPGVDAGLPESQATTNPHQSLPTHT